MPRPRAERVRQASADARGSRGPGRVHHGVGARLRGAGARLLLPSGHGEPLHGSDVDRGGRGPLLEAGIVGGGGARVHPRRPGIPRLPASRIGPQRRHRRQPELGARGNRSRPGVAAVPRSSHGGACMTWSGFWALVFYSSLAGFTVVSLLIAVKGVAEIRELLGTLRRSGKG